MKLTIDDGLILEAQRVGGHRIKVAAVAEALKEYIKHRKQLHLTGLFGRIDYAPDYDYKAHRHLR